MAGRRKSYDDLLTDCEQKIVRDVAVHFLSEKQATPHKRLVLAHRDPDAVIRLARYGLMSQPRGQQYLPTALGFQLSGDPMARRRARASFELVLRVLSKLFESEDLKSQFDVSEIAGLASKMFEGISRDDIWLGLYLASEFRIFNQ